MVLIRSLPALQGKSVRTLGLFAVALVAVFGSLILLARPTAAATCNFVSVGTNDFNTAGNWSCGTVPTGADDVLIGAGTTTNLSASVTVQNISVSGTLNAVSSLLQVTSTATVLSGGSVSSTSGILAFNIATSTGSFGTDSGVITVTSTFQNNGWFAIGSGTATFADTVTNAVSGTINNNTGVLRFAADFTNAGTFNADTGTTRYIDSGAANDGNVAAVTYYNLIIDKDDGFVATLTGSTTVSNAFTLSLGILSVNTQTFTVPGTYTNSGGQVTISSGEIIHALTSNAFTTSDGSATSTATITFTSGGELYVTLQDDNRNLSATTSETLTVTITSTAVPTDSETLTLTETAVASGIFRNTTALPLSYAPNATAEDGTFTINDSYTGTVTYTDAYDATDTGTDTITLTIAVSTSGGSGSSSTTGGGGLGASPGIPPVTTEFQEVQQVVVDGAVIPVHTLVKLVCPAGAGVNHPCTAVYYVSSQGKRHAFPNDKVYFTWYSDFSGVQLISETQMAGIVLGNNVTYKPGVKMVKFLTDPKVYAVEKGGLLRWVTSEAVAIALYGSAWNTMIDDINDAFYANYRFGADITSTADYNAATAEASVTFPSDSLQM